MTLEELMSGLIVNEPNSNIAYLVESEDLEKEIKKIAEDRLSETFNLEQYNLNRLPFIGEHFETAIIQKDSILLDKNFAKQIAKVVQKNRTVILMTKFDETNIIEIYEPLEFTDFNTIEEFQNREKLIVMKRWFKW